MRPTDENVEAQALLSAEDEEGTRRQQAVQARASSSSSAAVTVSAITPLSASALALLMVAVVTSDSAYLVAQEKVRITMRFYPYAILIFQNVGLFLFFLVVESGGVLLRGGGRTNKQPLATKHATAVPCGVYCFIAMLAALVDLLQVMAENHVMLSVINLLSLATVLLAVAFSRTLLKTTYNAWHYAGVALVVVGASLGVMGARGEMGRSWHHGGALFLLMGLSLSAPRALSLCWMERVCKMTDLPLTELGLWVSAFRLVFCVLLAPAYSVLDVFSPSLEDLPTHLLEGLQCVLAPTEAPHAICAGTSALHVAALVCLAVLQGVLMLAGVKYASTLILLMFLSLGTLVGAAVLTLPEVMGHMLLPLDLRSWILSAIVVIAGLVIFFAANTKRTRDAIRGGNTVRMGHQPSLWPHARNSTPRWSLPGGKKPPRWGRSRSSSEV